MNISFLNNPADAALAAAANANLITHMCYVQQRTPGMLVMSNPELVIVDSGLPCDTFNMIARTRLSPDNARQEIRRAIDYFASVNRPFSWWLNPGDEPANLGEFLISEGLEAAETEVAMAADLEKLNLVDLSPEGLQIQRVRTSAELGDFAQIIAENWTPPDEQVIKFYELAAPALLRHDSPIWLYVGYLGITAVAACEMTLGGGVAGLYSVCTREAYRRRGFGRALSLQPLLDAREIGCHTAILQAAAGIYDKIGFVPFGEITEYKTRT